MAKPDIVYVVDSDQQLLKRLSKTFASQRINVQTFSEPEQFLAMQQIETVNACLVLELTFPTISGIEVLRMLKQEHRTIPTIIFSANTDLESVVGVMELGAVNVIKKSAGIDALCEALRHVRYVSADDYAKKQELLDAQIRLSRLSSRERDVANLVAHGCSASEIAKRLFISSRTVEAHKASIFQKLERKSIASLTRLVVMADLHSDDFTV